jgi:hypothetical protein
VKALGKFRADPALFIGAVKIAVKERVTDQYAFCANQISQENISKKVKRPCGLRSNSGPGRENKNTFINL